MGCGSFNYMKNIFFAIALIISSVSLVNAQTVIPDDIKALLQKNTCLACHKVDSKLVGPGYAEVMKKKKYKPAQIVALIYKPKPSNWPGYIPMSALPMVPKDEALKIATWIASLK
jgi:cytochrome c